MRYKITIIFLSILIIVCLQCAPVTAEPILLTSLPVFPGAEGFGTHTPGGRGGQIIRVTSLADSGPGSLREALASREPRIIIFEVGGTIWLQNDLNILRPFITISGQTAPAPGITIAGKGVRIKTHDVLIQHLRFRGSDNNGVGISGVSDGSEEVYNIVLDHCSISWAVNKNLLTWFPNIHDVTVSNCIISESLPFPDSGNRMGFLIGDHTHNITVIGNLFAHNSKRNPAPYGDTTSVVINNVVYNPGPGAIHLQDHNESGSLQSSVVGNVIIPGPNTPQTLCEPEQCQPIRVAYGTPQGTHIYVQDNEAPGSTEDPWALVKVDVSFDVKVTEPPTWSEDLTIRPSDQVTDLVLTEAGARPWDRDPVDTRIVADVQNGTGRFAYSIADAGGWPDLPTIHRILQLPHNPHSDDDGDGYTNVEEWIFEFEQPSSNSELFFFFLPNIRH